MAQSVGQTLARLNGAGSYHQDGCPPLRLDVTYGPVKVVAGESARTLDAAERAALRRHMDGTEVDLSLNLHRGSSEALLYFSDLTHDYVTLNAEYST